MGATGDYQMLEFRIVIDHYPAQQTFLRADWPAILRTLDPAFQVTDLHFQYDDLSTGRKRHLSEDRQLARYKVWCSESQCSCLSTTPWSYLNDEAGTSCLNLGIKNFFFWTINFFREVTEYVLILRDSRIKFYVCVPLCHSQPDHPRPFPHQNTHPDHNLSWNQDVSTLRAGPSVTGSISAHTASSSLFPALDSVVRSYSKHRGICCLNFSCINPTECWISLKGALSAVASPGATSQHRMCLLSEGPGGAVLLLVVSVLYTNAYLGHMTFAMLLIITMPLFLWKNFRSLFHDFIKSKAHISLQWP